MQPRRVLATGLLCLFVGCAIDGAAPREPRGSTLERLGVSAQRSEARIELPRRANEALTIAAPRTDLSVRVTLSGALPVEGRDEDGATIHPGAIMGGDLVHVPIADGFEDLILFDDRPEREELVYELDITKVAGLRATPHGIELLDDGGSPRLRIENPWTFSATGKYADATLAIEGCAVDREEGAPWSRSFTRPGSGSCRLVVRWSDVAYPAVIDPIWKLGSSPTPRHSHGSYVFPNGNVLAISGTVSKAGMGNGPTDTIDIYNASTGTWTYVGFIPQPRIRPAIATTPSGKAFIAGGGGHGRPEFVSSDGVLSRASIDLNEIIFAQGSRATTLTNSRVLMTGGAPASTQAALYHEATDTYAPAGTSPSGAMKVGRAHHTATRLLNGRVLIVGGFDAGGTRRASAEIYDPATNTFTTTPNMMVARAQHTATLLADGTVLLAGGGSASAEIYDPTTNSFSATGAPGLNRVNGEAHVLASGGVIALGGQGPSASVEIYDVKTKQWVAQPNLTFARAELGSAVFPNGDVFAFGGLGVTGLSLGTSEIWKPGAAGSACLVGDDCKSGVCEEGVCCASACAPSCQTCVPGTGACVTVTSADDASSCTGTTTCDALGVCKKKNGQACAAAAECASGICADNTCCSSTCDGQCEACNLPGLAGMCAPVAGPPPRTPCAAAGTACAGTCNGVNGKECEYPGPEKPCGSSCSGSTLTQSFCDAKEKGKCTSAGDARACSGNLVCADAVACLEKCTSDASCIEGYRCDNGQCLPIALCEKQFVTKGTQRIDCYPYTCEQTGNCRESCASVHDCVEPTICSFDGKCIDPPPPPPEASCSIARASSPASGAALALAGLLFVARKRRRA